MISLVLDPGMTGTSLCLVGVGLARVRELSVIVLPPEKLRVWLHYLLPPKYSLQAQLQPSDGNIRRVRLPNVNIPSITSITTIFTGHGEK